MKRFTFIHSYEETTEFLDEILQFLIRRGYKDFEHIRIVSNDNNPGTAAKMIAKAESGSTIVFLGHGASHSVYMPLVEDRATKAFINKDNFDILNRKNFICLSCRSADFIKNNFVSEHGTAMIGFDNLPTHWHDVSIEREIEQFAFAGITDEVLRHFRDMLVNIFANSLGDAIYENLDFNQFYFRLRLHTNRLMYRTANYSISDNPTILANMLFEFKTGIRLFGNANASLF